MINQNKLKPKKPMFDFSKALNNLIDQKKAEIERAKLEQQANVNALADSLINAIDTEPKAQQSIASLTTNPTQSANKILYHLSNIESNKASAELASPIASPIKSTSSAESANPKLINLAESAPSLPTINWDESQLAAIDKILANKFCCLIGAAGSGKTTVVKEIVSRLKNEGVIQPLSYQRMNGQTRNVYNVAFVSFTGKAVEQLRKSIPTDLQCCCETIHSLLEYSPVLIDKLVTNSEGKTEMKTSRIFEPRRDEYNLLPQSIIIIDESGMVGIDLWNNLFKALDKSNPNLKIILIGDINQLPAVIGKSILGYALNSTRWITACLTHIHRQALDNPIIANAHAIKDGRLPTASEPLGSHLRKFNLINIGSLTQLERDKIKSGELSKSYYDIKNKPTTCLKTIVNIIAKLYQLGEYDPDVDQIIVPQNVGMLGQEMLNQKLAPIFNSANRRHAVRASYETKFLAVGDKVMFTKNDYDLGILNGMVGYIKSISLNTAYADYALMKVAEENETGYQPTVDEQSMNFAEQAFADLNKLAEDKEQDPTTTAELQASHIITIEYTPLGASEPASIAISKVGQVRGLLLAYAITCHKAQGSEYRKVIVITHSSNSQMLSREWLYTAVTRARENLLIIYNDYASKGLTSALRRQIVKGETIEDKAKNFSLAEATKESTKLSQSLVPLGIFSYDELASCNSDLTEVAE